MVDVFECECGCAVAGWVGGVWHVVLSSWAAGWQCSWLHVRQGVAFCAM